MKRILCLMMIFCSLSIFAQKKDVALARGNDNYKSEKFNEAEASFRVSQSRMPKKATSSYNLGNAIYKQNQIAESKEFYARAAKNAQTRPQKHYAYHNLGNVLMKEKNYQGAVEAYKNALRNNPADEETRYNYALAKEHLKNNPPEGGDDDKKDKDKKDQDKKDQENKDKNDQDKKDQDKKDGDKEKDNKGNNQPKEQPQPKPQPQPSGIPKERLENLLDAVNNQEQKVQQKVNAQKVKGKPVKTDKDW